MRLVIDARKAHLKRVLAMEEAKEERNEAFILNIKTRLDELQFMVLDMRHAVRQEWGL